MRLNLDTGSLTVVLRIALEIFKPGGPTSTIVFEIVWLCQHQSSPLIQPSSPPLFTAILWVLWLATGAESVEAATAFSLFGGCGQSEDIGDGIEIPDDGIPSSLCQETSGIAAFAFLNWLIRAFSICFYTP